jgi:type IV secretion system protein VirB1
MNVSASLAALLPICAPLVAPSTALAIAAVESSQHPWAIGVVGGRLVRQPTSLTEAVATARALERDGWNYSVGLAQINRVNFGRLGLDIASAFEPCNSLRAMQAVLGECFARASSRAPEQLALRQAFSCYYSGNFRTGFDHGYVDRVVQTALALSGSRPPAAGEGVGRSKSKLPAESPTRGLFNPLNEGSLK